MAPTGGLQPRCMTEPSDLMHFARPAMSSLCRSNQFSVVRPKVISNGFWQVVPKALARLKLVDRGLELQALAVGALRAWFRRNLAGATVDHVIPNWPVWNLLCLSFFGFFGASKSTFKMSIWDKFLAREKKGSFLGKEWDPSVWSQRLVLAAAALLELAKGGLTAATRFGGLHLGLGLASLTSVLKSWHCCLQNDTSIVTSLVELIWPQHGKIW